MKILIVEDDVKVAAVCRTYSLGVKYQFKAGRHCFIIDFS